MPKYRKKPVEVEARKFVKGHYSSIAEWCGGTVIRGVNNFVAWVEVPTIEGTMRGEVGDYIIKGVQGEFYPCKPDIFEATYEAVTDDD